MYAKFLLNNIPRNITVLVRRKVFEEARSQTTFFRYAAYTWLLWLVMIPVAAFPVTFTRSSFEACVYPDYANGTTFTLFRGKSKSFDFI